MTITRANRNLGAGHLLFGSSLASKMYCTQIKAEVVTGWMEHVVGGFGRIGRTKVDEIIRLTCTPTGEFSAAIAALLWPYGATTLGTSIFGATDTAFGVHTMAGQKWSFHCGAVTRMPKISVGAGKLLYGDFEITCIVKNNTARSTANSLYTQAAVAWSGQPSLASVVKLPLTSAAWALGSPESITAKDGWEIDFNLALDWQTGADVGTFDALFSGLEVSARCLPLNYADARLDDLKIQGTGNDIGTGARTEADLTLIQANPGATIVLKNASLDKLDPQFADRADRFPEAVWLARRDISAGFGAVFSIAQTSAG